MKDSEEVSLFFYFVTMSNSDVKKSYLAFEHSCFLCVLFLFIFLIALLKARMHHVGV